MTLLDVAALLVALPTMLTDLYALVALPKGRSGAAHPLARMFRWLDARAHHLMSQASYLAAAWLLARLAAASLASSLPLTARLALVACIAALAVYMMYPLLAFYNAVGAVAWANPPLGLDKRAYFPASALLEDPASFRALRRELEAVMASELACPITDVYQNLTIVKADGDARPTPQGAALRGWRSFFLRVADRNVDENMARMPTLAALLGQMPEAYNVLFSILDPGHGIVPHRGYFKGILRYHLGVVVPSPDDAWLVCGGERYHWREGEGVVFDDMFVHSVENRCASPRVVLFIDVRRRTGALARGVTDALLWIITRHPYHRGVRARAAGR